jgi:retron-type reverse transcriptase
VEDYTHLTCQYNVISSTTLANDLTKLTLNGNHRMIKFDIKDLYVNIPIDETITITQTLISDHNNKQIIKQISTFLETILKQNYLAFQGNIYQPTKGVYMGSPISGIMAEIFLQHIENTQLKQILDKNNIIFYTTYVDDRLIIYVTNKITPEAISDHINCIHPALQFSPTHEQNNTINFLHLTIIQHPSKIEIDIYRKPTTTDTTINYTSNYPTEHKMAT